MLPKAQSCALKRSIPKGEESTQRLLKIENHVTLLKGANIKIR